MAGSRVEDAAGINVIATKQPPLPVPRHEVISSAAGKSKRASRRAKAAA